MRQTIYLSVDGSLLCFVSYFNARMILYGDPILIKEKLAFSSSGELILDVIRSKMGVIAYLYQSSVKENQKLYLGACWHDVVLILCQN